MNRRDFLKGFFAVSLLSYVNIQKLYLLNNEYNFFIKNFFSMGTYGKVCVITKDKIESSVIFKVITDKFSYLENKLTKFSDFSDIGILNKKRSNIVVSDDTFHILKLANLLNKETGYYFDVGVGSFLNGKIKDVGVHKVEQELLDFNYIDNRISILKRNFDLDLGGIGKGYAVEEMSKLLISMGFYNFYIELGGDIFVFGGLPNGSPWEINLDYGLHTENNKTPFRRKIYIKTGGISSSGYVSDSFVDLKVPTIRNKHIINPLTLDYNNNYKFITVVGKDLVICDALSTACFNVLPKYLEEFKKSFSGYKFYVFN